MANISSTGAWQSLEEHAQQMATLRELFTGDTERGLTFRQEVGELYVDYSKQRVTTETMDLLFALADEAQVLSLRDQLFGGVSINTTEDRAVLHPALRNVDNSPVELDGEDVMEAVNRVLNAMRDFSEEIRTGSWVGYDGKPIKNVINIGIGGSHLGPQMAYRALQSYAHTDLNFRFLSNVDGAEFAAQTAGLDPSETLFIVASKTFTTQETMTNAQTAKEWLIAHFQDEAAVAQHFVAVSTNQSATEEFGIHPENVFGFWGWVGGRYSLTSAIGLSLMIAIGPDNFDELRAGCNDMDEHFKTAAPSDNLPLKLGLIEVWNRNFLAATSKVVVPYATELTFLPAYLQQADMESNGKRVTKAGEVVSYPTGPVVWGGIGTDVQHAFFQLLHQGTDIIPADFIGFIEPHHVYQGHHEKLLANLLAQTKALAFGKENADEPHRDFPGNRPSTTILAQQLSPRTLGQLIALYEHSIFVQGAVWGINSFDQFGVELGKELAGDLLPALTQDNVGVDDSSTAALIERMKN
jgi:glucose-6-phosphate isomerase